MLKKSDPLGFKIFIVLAYALLFAAVVAILLGLWGAIDDELAVKMMLTGMMGGFISAVISIMFA